MSPEERFWLGVERKGPDECWPSIGTVYCAWNGKNTNKRRVAWVLTHGPLRKGQMVLARCSSASCCNPSHSMVGTKKILAELRTAKGRSTSGAKNSHAILTDELALEILRNPPKRGHGGNVAEYAAKYNVGRHTINALLSGRSWKHLRST